MTDTPRSLISEIIHERSLRKIASAAGLDQSTLSRQMHGDLKIQTLIAISRAYNKPLVAFLVAAGHMTLDEQSNDTQFILREASDQQLVDEIIRRVVEGSATDVLVKPSESRAN